MRTLLWLLAGAAVLCAQSRPVLRGRASVDVGPSLEEIYKDKDPEKGQKIVLNSHVGETEACPERPGLILVYFNRTTKHCYYWAPNPPEDQYEEPSRGGRPAGGGWAGVGGAAGNGRRDPCEIDGNLTPEQRSRIYNSAEYRELCRQGSVRQPPRNPTKGGDNGNRNRNTVSDPKLYWEGYARGIADGAGECIRGFFDLLGGVGLVMQGNFEAGAAAMGLEPGQSITLRALTQEIRDSAGRGNMSPFESGKVAGRRFCMYGLVSGAAKAGEAAAAKAGGAIRRARTPGATPRTALTADSGFKLVISESPATVENMWVQTAEGPMKLGEHLGSGTMGAVFRDGTNPRQVIKVSNTHKESAPSFPRQEAGSRVLQQNGIPTPTIRRSIPGQGDNASFLVIDDMRTAFPNAFEQRRWETIPAELKMEIRQATERLYKEIVDIGYIWPDGHLGNLAFERMAGGGVRAIVVDSDFLIPADAVRRGLAGTGFPGDIAAGVVWNTRFDALIHEGGTAAEWMNAFHELRFPRGGVPTDGTVVH